MLLRGQFYSKKFQEITEEFLNDFNESPEHDVPPDIIGSGVYALYYVGDFPLYSDYVEVNSPKLVYPIYVGKTSPSFHKTQIDRALTYRIKKHYESVGYAKNLNTDHLRNKYLVVHPSNYQLIPALESHLINKFHPLWNGIMKGFGSTNISAGRKQHQRSVWDEIHPGRPWAKLRPDREVNTRQLEYDILQHINRYKPSL